MLKDKNALINELERLYTLSDEKLNLNQLQTLSEEELRLVVGGFDGDGNQLWIQQWIGTWPTPDLRLYVDTLPLPD